uniref:Bacterial surface antigen (D15) domain-containing protein n=1 Tax=Tetradesmus obliquus TaxID=3088 RepID=A0A383VQ38_TETOB|eukprot:jgi/Sobl393_1/11595/SZX67013.1
MDQLLKSLNDLHQAASSVCLHLQQLPASLTQVGRSNNPSSGANPFALSSTRSGSHSRACSQGSGRRVHFAPPFAAINNAFTAQGGGTGGQAAGKGGRSSGKGSSSKQEDEDEERILISEVEVVGVSEDLKRIAYDALTTRPNFAYTLKEVQADLKRVFATGWFSSCVPDAEDTRDGVKLVIKVAANPELRGVVARGADALPTAVLQKAMRPLYGGPLNFVAFSRAVERLDGWYRERGILGQVIDFNFEGGIVDLTVGEAAVGSIELAFLDPATNSPKAQGATKPGVIRRHLTTQPGRVYSLRQAKADIDSVYSTGLFEDVNIVPQEAEDSTETQPKVDLTVNLVERKTGGLGAGTGISAAGRGSGNMPGFVGNFTYSQRNLLGLNQKLSALVELGQADSLFRLQWVDPWIRGDPNRTSMTLSMMNTRTSAAAIHGKALEPDASPADAAADARGAAGGVTLGRLVAGTEWRRPLAANWSGIAGLTWQRSCCMDSHGTPLLSDAYGAPLTFSGRPSDSMMLGVISGSYSANDGSSMGISLEQALPLHPAWLNFNRLRLRLEQPVTLGPLTLQLRGKAGSVYGDLPPYEAFPLGGTNSVRGYAEGGVGSGRHFVEGTAELRWLLAKPVHGTLFADYGSDLDSGESVIGDPAGTRGKPGSGYGFGGGIRIDSPLGPVRLEYAWNDQRRGRFHVALGYD